MYELVISNAFRKQIKKYLNKHKDKESAVEYVLELLCKDIHNSELNTHKLKGKYKDYMSSRIDYSHRIVYRPEGKNIHLVAIGDHDTVY
jgi:addiction module RelE/StbE family toxin